MASTRARIFDAGQGAARVVGQGGVEFERPTAEIRLLDAGRFGDFLDRRRRLIVDISRERLAGHGILLFL
jgi:hypothetical protein